MAATSPNAAADAAAVKTEASPTTDLAPKPATAAAAAPAPPAFDTAALDEAHYKRLMREYYNRCYPVSLVAEWLAYDNGPSYLARREFSLTLFGDIFTRHKSFEDAGALKKALLSQQPEKFDVGAIYNVPPNKKMVTTIVPMERELVFDIDMTDYDAVRSCCSGKKVCELCWGWMATAAEILREIVTEAFGFKRMMPVFSGRRGVHLWVCDEASRKLTDEERTAMVGYLTVVVGAQKVNVTRDLLPNGPGLHPSMAKVHQKYLAPAFERIFVDKVKLSDHVDADGNAYQTEVPNRNSLFLNSDSCAVVWETLCSIERDIVYKADRRVAGDYELEAGVCFSESQWASIVRKVYPGALTALHFALMYPRLDEKVSTRRDHLLKLPFCIHPGTQKCCVPLTWGRIQQFNPDTDPPRLGALLEESGAIPAEWVRPLVEMVNDLRADRKDKDAALAAAAKK